MNGNKNSINNNEVMRNTLIAFILLLSIPAAAQKIGYRQDNDHYLEVGTNYRITNVFGSCDAGVALVSRTIKGTKETTYDLCLYVETYNKTFCQEHSRAVFKTFRGSIITLEQFLDTYKVQNTVERVGDYNSSTYCVYPRYHISEKELTLLMNEGVQVLRVETLKGYKDFTYSNDILGEYIASEYNLILGKQDFGAGF